MSIPEAAVPDLTEAIRGAFRSGGFVVLTPNRFRRMQENWQLCRDGKGWAGHPHRPWQNRDMVNNMLRDTKLYLHKAGIDRDSVAQKAGQIQKEIDLVWRVIGLQEMRVRQVVGNLSVEVCRSDPVAGRYRAILQKMVGHFTQALEAFDEEQ